MPKVNEMTDLILNIDTPPWVLPASVPQAGVLVRDGNVGANHSEGESLPHPVVFALQLRHWEVVDLDLVLLKL